MPDHATVVLDACTVMTFGKVNRLDVITELSGCRVVIGSRALAEVKREPAQSVLAKAVRQSRIVVEAVDLGVPAEATALAHFDSMTAFRGRGEAEALALATTRGYTLASDEVAVRDALRVHDASAPFLTSIHLLRQAVRERRLTLDEAVALFSILDVEKGVSALLRRLGYGIRELLQGS